MEMPSMGMSSDRRKFPVYSGVDGIIEGGFGVDANIGFGFDTSGLQEWMDDEFAAEDFWKVFNGFYVNDRNDDGVDIPEFTLDASMGLVSDSLPSSYALISPAAWKQKQA